MVFVALVKECLLVLRLEDARILHQIVVVVQMRTLLEILGSSSAPVWDLDWDPEGDLCAHTLVAVNEYIAIHVAANVFAQGETEATTIHVTACSLVVGFKHAR